MSEFITLTCPSCGGKLQITNDIERFVCANCGTEMLVRRGGGIISLSPIIAEVEDVRRAAESTAAELAITRIQKEVDSLNNQLRLKDTSKEYIQIYLGIFGLVIAYLIRDYGAYCYGVALVSAFNLIVKTLVIIKKKKGIEEIRAQLDEKHDELNRHLDTLNRI